MKKLLVASTALALTAVPAHAQLLGSGSLTGTLNSGLDLGSTISRTTETVRSSTRGAVEGSVKTDGEQRVDRKSGRVEARRNADLTGAAMIDQLATTPIAPVGASASGNGQATGSGEAQAQLIGTDAVRGLSASAVGEARSAAGSAQALAGPVVNRARGAAGGLANTAPAAGGSANGEGSASGAGSASVASIPLVVAGTAASAARGSATVAPGMPVLTPEGLPIGKVRQIVADSRGEVQHVLVSNGDASTLIPAGNLALSGNALVAGKGEAATEAGQPATDAE